MALASLQQSQAHLGDFTASVASVHWVSDIVAFSSQHSMIEAGSLYAGIEL